MIFKKALEPLIATILLIVVVVILVTIVLSFGTNFSTKSLDRTKESISTKDAVVGLFFQSKVTGNTIFLKNLSNIDYNIVGYTILSSDYNSDHFWINSYHLFETPIFFSQGGNSFFPLLCMPNNKFKLELQDNLGNRYLKDISTTGNTNYTSCREYNVPLWEFETISGSKITNTFSKQKGERAINGNFDTNVSNWNVSRAEPTWQEGGYCRLTQNHTESYNMAIAQNNMVTNKRYRISFIAKSPNTTQPPGITSIFYSGIIYISRPNLSSDWQYYEMEGTALDITTVLYFPSAYVPVGTIIDIDNISVTEIDPLPTITDGTKYLEATTDGTISIPSTQAYGTWEFDLIRTVGTNNLYIYFIRNNNFTGYSIELKSDKRVNFWYDLPGQSIIFSTNSNYFDNKVWYRIKITRTKAGTFSIYIKGGSFGDNWVQIDNSKTNNLYNTSDFFFVSIKSGDRITNLKITPEIE